VLWLGFTFSFYFLRGGNELGFVSDKWPQPDYWGWFSNTLATCMHILQSIFSIRPDCVVSDDFGVVTLFGKAICACQTPGVSVYVSLNPGTLDFFFLSYLFLPSAVGPNYNGACPAESVLLAFYIMTLLLYGIMLLVNIYDLAILLFYAYLKEDVLTQPVKVLFFGLPCCLLILFTIR
jgi:hypothetical protein